MNRVLGEFAYDPETVIGRGPTGTVYAGRLVADGRPVAVKALSAEAVLDRETLERFYVQARTLAAVEDPRVLAVYGAGPVDGEHFVVEERVQGEDLERIVARRKRLPAREALTVGLEVAAALAAAARAGVLHGDLKPTNVLRSSDGAVKVSDFGLGELARPEAGTAPQVASAYSAPEAREGRGGGAPADVYALGVLLYRMLTGQLPLAGETAAPDVLAQEHAAMRSPRALEPSVPEAAEQIVLRCLAYRPEDRFATAEAVEGELRGLVRASEAPRAAGAPTGEVVPLRLMNRPRPAARPAAPPRPPAQPAPAVHEPSSLGVYLVATALVVGYALWRHWGEELTPYFQVAREMVQTQVPAGGAGRAVPGGGADRNVPGPDAVVPAPTDPAEAIGGGEVPIAGGTNPEYARYYTQGLEATLRRDWRAAEEAFSAAARVAETPEALAKLAAAQAERRIDDRIAAADALADAGQEDKAIAEYEAIRRDVPGRAEELAGRIETTRERVDERLAAQRQSAAAGNLAQAREARARGDWSAVERLAEEALRLEKSEEAESLRVEAHARLAEAAGTPAMDAAAAAPFPGVADRPESVPPDPAGSAAATASATGRAVRPAATEPAALPATAPATVPATATRPPADDPASRYQQAVEVARKALERGDLARARAATEEALRCRPTREAQALAVRIEERERMEEAIARAKEDRESLLDTIEEPDSEEEGSQEENAAAPPAAKADAVAAGTGHRPRATGRVSASIRPAHPVSRPVPAPRTAAPAPDAPAAAPALAFVPAPVPRAAPAPMQDEAPDRQVGDAWVPPAQLPRPAAAQPTAPPAQSRPVVAGDEIAARSAGRPLPPTPVATSPAVAAPPPAMASGAGMRMLAGSDMVLVPAGEFPMGDDAGAPDETPMHRVELRAFRIDRHEVSNADYGRFLAAIRQTGDHSRCHPGEPKGKDHTPRFWEAPTLNLSDLPVVGVDWFDAYAYAHWAGKRLPTEAEWEKAARGTDGRRFPWGPSWDPRRCNFREDGRLDGFANTASVNSFADGVSPWGVLNMVGNVTEWCADWYHPATYRSGVVQDPTGPAAGTERMLRGGSYGHDPQDCTTVSRSAHAQPGERSSTIGFRCAAD